MIFGLRETENAKYLSYFIIRLRHDKSTGHQFGYWSLSRYSTGIGFTDDKSTGHQLGYWSLSRYSTGIGFTGR